MADVDLIVNCFERSYRHVLAPGFFPRIAADNDRPFAERTALINNVDDREDARARAEALLEAGEITRYRFVADYLDAALARTGLTRAELEPIPWFTDFAIVAATLDGPDWFLHWDADLRLRRPADWVTPAIALMDRDPRVMAANPMWPDDNLASFTTEVAGPFTLGHGFTDQAFLGRRSEFGRPIYTQRCVARWRYPLSHVGPIFEARVDAHLRHHGRLRATYRDAVYEHEVAMGTSWPAQGRRQRLAELGHHAGLTALRALPWRPPHLRQL